MTLKKDRKRTSSVVLPSKYKGKYDRARYDVSGYDTKKQVKGRVRKVHEGKRGGHYVIVNGQKRYLRK